MIITLGLGLLGLNFDLDRVEWLHEFGFDDELELLVPVAVLSYSDAVEARHISQPFPSLLKVVQVSLTDEILW